MASEARHHITVVLITERCAVSHNTGSVRGLGVDGLPKPRQLIRYFPQWWQRHGKQANAVEKIRVEPLPKAAIVDVRCRQEPEIALAGLVVTESEVALLLNGADQEPL